MRILVLGYGNPGRGDDGIGPALVERLERHFLQAGNDMGRVSFLVSMQLHPEHVLEMERHERVVLIDAGQGSPLPFRFERVSPRRDDSFSSHALSPWSLLAIYRDILLKQPPPTFLLTVRGDDFALGASLSPGVLLRMEQAFTFALAFLQPGIRGLQSSIRNGRGSYQHQ